MKYSRHHQAQEPAIVAMFTQTFTDSESAGEGAAIGELVDKLLRDTPADDLAVFVAEDAGQVVGGILFTRLTFAEEKRQVFLLAPVAGASSCQGQGVGQALIRLGLDALRATGVDVAITYGDPAFYSRVGFQPISEAEARPPLPLSQPEGWLGQSLSEPTLRPLAGPSTCVAAFHHPAYW